jgi:AraC-like DNA-binding protein
VCIKFSKKKVMVCGTPITAGRGLRQFDSIFAGRLLKTGEGRSLTEVAGECGFADQAHLARNFRRAYGVSPSDFRKTPDKQESTTT